MTQTSQKFQTSSYAMDGFTAHPECDHLQIIPLYLQHKKEW